MSETMTPASVVRQMRDMAQFKGDSLSPEDIERNCTAAADALDSMQAALADILGLLDDPTGGNHVEDMRAASIRARQGLGLDLPDTPSPASGG